MRGEEKNRAGFSMREKSREIPISIYERSNDFKGHLKIAFRDRGELNRSAAIDVETSSKRFPLRDGFSIGILFNIAVL